MSTIEGNNEDSIERQTTTNADAKINNHSINGEDIIEEAAKEPVATEDMRNVSDPPTIPNFRIVDVTPNKHISRTMSISNATEIDPGPIIGYADEPLLPLFKACAPLADIIHNISFYVQAALNETPEQPPDGLTIDESAAIRLYTMQWDRSYRSLYSMLNHTLKNSNREQLQPYFKYLKLFLTALAKLPCVPSLTIWRGVTTDLSAEFPPGTPVTWWAFSSCTTELTVLENNVYLGSSGDRTLFSVEAINARRIDGHSHFVEENEVLLLPGTHMTVQSQFSPAADLHIVHLKQVIVQEILLEPPFEGNLYISTRLFSLSIFSISRSLSLSESGVSCSVVF